MTNNSMIRVPTALATGAAAAALLALTDCTVAKDVFKAGVWVGVLAIVAVLLVVGAATSLMKKA